MAKSKQTFLKNENEKKKQLKKKEKEEKKAQRKSESGKKGLDDMIAYLDHNGRITSTPPDPKMKVEIKLEDILVGARTFAAEEVDNTKQGVVATFHHDKNFGFIKVPNSSEQIFFHASQVEGSINEGDKIEFEIGHGNRGVLAINIKKIS